MLLAALAAAGYFQWGQVPRIPAAFLHKAGSILDVSMHPKQDQEASLVTRSDCSRLNRRLFWLLLCVRFLQG